MTLGPIRLHPKMILMAAVAILASILPGIAGVFFEGFEDGTLGAMAPMNLDSGKFSLEASDGYRCQYSDPDWVNSNSYGVIADCWLGATELQGDAFFWQVVDGLNGDVEGRAFTGQYAVWMGVTEGTGHERPGPGPSGYIHGMPDDPASTLTAPLATLEALVTAAPIHLAAAGDPPPELSFKHQISLPDSRVVNTSGPLRSVDGGVVQVQVVDAGGEPVGHWTTLQPHVNGYDQQREDYYVNCMFDPIDDGNTEDDFYDPDDPERRTGPSSLCYDQSVFTYLGDTDEPFDAANLGNAVGPGLEGEAGLGTWVESRFDLSAYRGQSILIRFITSGIKVGAYESYDDVFMWNPTPADDGWFIDDITVTGTVDSAP